MATTGPGPPVRRHRVGDLVCSGHDVVTPVTGGPVPTCPHCGGMVLRVIRQRGVGHVVYAEPAPTHCDGPQRHELGPNQVLVGWGGCECPDRPHRGHRTWSCRRYPSRLWAGSH